MKKSLFNNACLKIIGLLLCLIGTAFTASAGSTVTDFDTIPSDSLKRLRRYEQRLSRLQAHWQRLIPSYGKVQYAGNMGLISVGGGWAYGKNRQWETDLLIGFLPKYKSDAAKATLTLKQNFMPWRWHTGEHIFIEPLACGLYLNTVLHNDFWVRQPDRYPKGYYWFSTRIRTNIYIGQRITFKIPPHKRFFTKAITAFYEISTCDYYILSHVGNSGYPLHELISLSFGVKLQIF